MNFPHLFARLVIRFGGIAFVLRWLLGQRIWAVAALTWKAAFRFRLFWVMAALLLGSVVVLPLLIRDDGTARGFIQIMLTYTLSVITALLGFSTLWLACGTLARDIEDCSIQLVVVKPISRWQIWIGKFIGIMLLNAVLLTLAGLSVYSLLQWRSRQLDPRERVILRNEIFVARTSLKEAKQDIEGTVNAAMQKVTRESPMSPQQQDETRRLLREDVRRRHQVVPPDHLRRWTIDLGLLRHTLRDTPMFLRVKFNAAQTNVSGSYLGLWNIGPPNTPQVRSLPQSLAADTFHEIQIPPNLFDESGKLTIDFENRNDTALIFSLEEGLELLYREGGFGLNFARGVMVIYCWLALLTTLGLASASLLSFPVAAFCSISLLLVCLSSGTLSTVVSEGTMTGLDHETGAGSAGLVDALFVPMFKGLLGLVKMIEEVSPVEALSTGRSITWSKLGGAFARIVLLLGGVLSLAGIAFFSRRELAATQPQS